MSPTGFSPGRVAVKSRPTRSGGGRGGGVDDGGADPAAARPAPPAPLGHDPGHPLAGQAEPVAPQPPPHPRAAVAAPRRLPDRLDLPGQHLLLPVVAGAASRPGVEAGAGHAAHPAQDLDRKVGLLAVDELEDPHELDSFTQTAVARFRISRSISNSATRFRSRFNSSRSSSVIGAWSGCSPRNLRSRVTQ